MASRYAPKRYKNTDKYSLLLSQIGVCVLLTVMVLLINSIDTNMTRLFSENIKNTLHYNVDVNTSAAELYNTVKDLKADFKQTKPK